VDLYRVENVVTVHNNEPGYFGPASGAPRHRFCRPRNNISLAEPRSLALGSGNPAEKHRHQKLGKAQPARWHIDPFTTGPMAHRAGQTIKKPYADRYASVEPEPEPPPSARNSPRTTAPSDT
jgi:hypothetical protein